MMKFSVIVPTYNRAKMLDNLIISLLAQDLSDDYEIIIVDDGSNDSTEDIVERHRRSNSNIKFIHAEHKGCAAARNIGVSIAKGDILAFTDDDCIVPKNWLSKISGAFDDNSIHSIGGSIINPTDRYIAWAQYILNFSSWFPKGKRRKVRDIPTANIAYRKDIFMDHRFPEYLGEKGYSDSLFNFGLFSDKKNILFFPSISVRHHTWDADYRLGRFFSIQKKAAQGFISGGSKVHGRTGYILSRYRFLNLLCPRIFMVAGRCIRYGYFTKFILTLPLLLAGEFYRGLVILKDKGN